MSDTYPGTELLVRQCYHCEKEITELSDLWVDVDSNCCVCTDCRNMAAAAYDTLGEWELSIVPATNFFAHDINDIEEG